MKRRGRCGQVGLQVQDLILPRRQLDPPAWSITTRYLLVASLCDTGDGKQAFRLCTSSSTLKTIKKVAGILYRAWADQQCTMQIGLDCEWVSDSREIPSSNLTKLDTQRVVPQKKSWLSTTKIYETHLSSFTFFATFCCYSLIWKITANMLHEKFYANTFHWLWFLLGHHESLHNLFTSLLFLCKSHHNTQTKPLFTHFPPQPESAATDLWITQQFYFVAFLSTANILKIVIYAVKEVSLC